MLHQTSQPKHSAGYRGLCCRIASWLLIIAASAMCMVRGQVVDTLVSSALSEPYGVAVTDANLIYITDGGNHRIALYNPDAGTLTTLAGSGHGAQDASDGSSARFFVPSGIALVSNGMVVTDTGNNVIRHVSFSGAVTTLAGNLQSAEIAHEIGLNPDNAAFNDGIGQNASFHSPTGLAWDGGTKVYIADTGNNRIRILELTNNSVSTLEIEFESPTAVAVTTNGTLYVAERTTHSIRKYVPNAPSATLLAGGGSAFKRGFQNASIATQALFNAPRGLLLNERKGELLVADTDNGVIRRVYGLNTAPGVDTYSPAGAGMMGPIGLARDPLSAVLIADVFANKIWKIRTSGTPQPQIATPQIGTVFPTDFCFATFGAITNAVYNNDVRLAISAERDTITYYTYGNTDNEQSIPDPRPDNGALNPPFFNADDCAVLPQNMLAQMNPRPARLTIKAYSTQAERQSSKISTANITFQVANPAILGNNPASISFQSGTTNAIIYYTTGNDEESTPEPTPGEPSTKVYVAGSNLNIIGGGRQTIFLKARGYRDGYVPSARVAREFNVGDIQKNFVGIPRNITAAAGTQIVVPIEVQMSTSNILRSVQFRVEASGSPIAPSVSVLDFPANAFIPVNGPKVMPNFTTNYSRSITGGDVKGIGVVYSGGAGVPFPFSISNTVTLALLRVNLPAGAADGSKFQISVVNVSGTSDGQQEFVSMSGLPTRTITIQNGLSYLVGDASPASGYNIGDFGNDILENSDYNTALFAELGIRVPYEFTSLFNALDVFPVRGNGVPGGDRILRFLDTQHILLRSLGLRDEVAYRTWVNGTLTQSQTLSGLNARQSAGEPSLAWDRPVLMGVDNMGGIPQGAPLRLPVFIAVDAGKEVAGLSFNAQVRTDPSHPFPAGEVRFIPASGIPAPSVTGPSVGDAYVGAYASWHLGTFNPPLTGSNVLGYIEFSIPVTAVTGKSYYVSLVNADGAPDLNTQYDFETVSGQVVVNAVAPNRVPFLPVEWVRHFASAGNDPLSDLDGDGASNWSEYLSGSDPGVNTFILNIDGHANQISVTWYAHAGVSYQLETADQPTSHHWVATGSSVVGAGANITVHTPRVTTHQFFRIRTLNP